MKSSKNMLVLAGLGVLVLAAMLLAREDAPEAPAHEATAPAPAVPSRPAPTPAEQARPSAPLPKPPELLAAPEEFPGEEGEHGEFTTTTDVVKQKIFKTEPRLAQFDYFREHVLLDSNGRKDYQVLLADRSMYEQTRSALSHPGDDKDSMESNVKRLMRIDYLREALSWKENPERPHLLSTLEGIILEDSFEPGMGPEVKRSLAATKFELFELLYKQDPERARALVGSARGTRLEKLMEYIATRTQRIVAKEQDLSLQAKRTGTP
ncbi:hypothetical protein [Archangium violaceum]|uniref:hypothetical protein n=1 Tax=Archangium violaceum TaxID=83451 RepID=UPI0036DEC72D